MDNAPQKNSTQTNSDISSLANLTEKNIKSETPENALLLKRITETLYANNLELNNERNRINKILLNVTEVIFAVNQDYVITIFNRKAEEVFEKKSEEVLGKNLKDFIKIINDETGKKINQVDYTFKNPNTIIERVRIKTQKEHGTQYYRLASTYIDQEENKKEAVVVLSNITNEVELDKQKDEFISIASHELKTPISITKNNLWMLQNTSKKHFTKREQRFLNEMNEGLGRLQKIINNLLDISRIEQGRLLINSETVDINKIAIDLLDSFKELAEKKNLSLEFDTTNKKAIANVDKERYIECIENLVGNAIKYTAHGKIKFNFINDPDADRYKIEISDTGPGIPEKDYPKIFTKFGRASEGLKLEGASSSNSTGLGLYITKNYVEAMGGKIGFTSKVNKGTTFWFTIPKQTKK